MERPSIATASLSARWLYALKPASWPKLGAPALLGIALGIAETHQISGTGALLAALFTVLDLVYIVMLNDWGDQDVDAIKRGMFPEGCSPKTIPDGILPARHLLVVGVIAGVGALAIGWIGTLVFERPSLVLLAGIAVLLFAAYTLPPLALNYRGGGELVEMLGVGVVLPLVTARFMGGTGVGPIAAGVLPGLSLLALSSALASGLSDEESDRAGGKRTYTTRLGNPAVRRLSLAALIAGGGALLTGSFSAQTHLRMFALLPLAFFGLRASRASAMAVTNAFAAQGAMKRELHLAIWGTSILLSAALVFEGLRGA